MSTRCQIGIYSVRPSIARNDLGKYEALIYCHSDGYPEGIIPQIVPFIKRFKEARGNDTEYLAARLLQYLCNEADRVIPEWSTIGFGLGHSLRGDIEYYYAVSPYYVDVYEVTGSDWGTKIDSIPL